MGGIIPDMSDGEPKPKPKASAGSNASEKKEDSIIGEERVFLDRLDLNPRKLREKLKGRVIGQDHAVDVFVDGLVQQAVDLSPERPTSFLFLGPTGVGKNYLVEETARALRTQRLEAGTWTISGPLYAQSYQVAKLLGSPPGYVDGEIKPLFKSLEEECETSHFFFPIFDEFEKGHPKLHNLLLGLTDTGIAETARGYDVDLRRASIVMTSNAGYSDIEVRKKTIGYTDRTNDRRSLSEEFLKRHFAPELLGRVEQVHFRSLSEEEIHQVAELELEKLTDKIRLLGIEVKVSDDVVPHLVDIADWENYGCRNIRNVAVRELGKQLNHYTMSILQGVKSKFNGHHIERSDEEMLNLLIETVAYENTGLQLSMANGRPVVEMYRSANS